MKVIDHINNSKKTLFSFELLPPLKGHNISGIYRTIDPLLTFNPRLQKSNSEDNGFPRLGRLKH